MQRSTAQNIKRVFNIVSHNDNILMTGDLILIVEIAERIWNKDELQAYIKMQVRYGIHIAVHKWTAHEMSVILFLKGSCFLFCIV